MAMAAADTVSLNTIRRVLEGTVEVVTIANSPSPSKDDGLTEATHRLMGDLSRVLDLMLPRSMTDEHYEALDDVVNEILHKSSR